MDAARSAHPEPIHVLNQDAHTVALALYDQVSAIAALAGASRPGHNLSGEEWMALLNPVADQLHALAKMLEHDASEVRWSMFRAG